jgi:HlyD family type I secretion membrane fusion protein
MLLKEGLTTRQRVFALKRERARLEGEIGEHVSDLSRAETARGETELQMLQVEKDQLEESATELSEVRTRLITFGERLTAVRQALDQTEIKAPVEGVVVDLGVHTEGGIVAKGETLLEIVPAKDRLIVEARVRPQDVDVVAVGQAADIRFTAFNLRTTPVLEGRLDYLSADSLVDQATNQPYFLARVSVPEEEMEAFNAGPITPGMPAEVIIKSGELTALAYLMRPLTNSFARAWREN